MLDAGSATRLRAELEQFERETSNQLLVAIYPKLPADEALEDFTVRTAESWGAGRKAEDNGVVLFIFRDDRLVRIEVGYGLEGAIPDGVAARIIANEIRPRFRAGDFSGGVTTGVRALMAAAKGEYTGSGKTLAETKQGRQSNIVLIVMGMFVMLTLYRIIRAVFTGSVYQSSGRRMIFFPEVGGHRSSGGSWGGGGGGGGGSGMFTGGGGSFGGGGASGSW